MQDIAEKISHESKMRTSQFPTDDNNPIPTTTDSTEY